MRKIAVFSHCYYTYEGIIQIIKGSELFISSLMTSNSTKLLSEYYRGIPMHDVFVQVQSCDLNIIRIIQEFVRSRFPPRVIVMMQDAHSPTINILRSLGVRFFLSQRDPLEGIIDVLQNYEVDGYISGNLITLITTAKDLSCSTKVGNSFDKTRCLTAVESEMILDLLDGVSAHEIANNRFISINTVNTHKHNALRKIGIKKLNDFFVVPLNWCRRDIEACNDFFYCYKSGCIDQSVIVSK